MTENIVEKYNRVINELSSIKFKELEKYDIGKMMADNVYLYYTFGINSHAFIKAFSTIFFSNEQLPNLSEIPENSKMGYLSVTYNGRKDFRYIYQRLNSIYSDFCVLEEKAIHKINPQLLVDMNLAFKWYTSLNKFEIEDDLRWFLVKRLVVCKKLERYIKKYAVEKRISCFISLYDAHDTDNILSQYFQHHNIPTITLQHGHFKSSVYLSDSAFSFGVAFKGFVSDYFLAWGDYAKEEAISDGISPQKIITVGTLKDQPNKIEKWEKNRVFGLVLNGRYGYDENRYLLNYADKISEKLDLKYIIRQHPSKQKKESEFQKNKRVVAMSNSTESLYELAQKCDFIICGNSTVFSEMIYMYECAFSMYPTDTIDYYDRFTQLRFENEIDLERLVAEYYSKSEGLLEMVNDCRNKLFQLGNVENNYEEAINKIIRWNGKKC